MSTVDYGMQIEILATQEKWGQIEDMIIKHPDLVRTVCSDDTTALIKLAYFGRLDLIGVLLRSGADPNHRDAEGTTPLLACCEGAYENRKTLWATAVLLGAGADPNSFARYGKSALHWAVTWKLQSHVRLLIQFGADPYQKCDDASRPEDSFSIARRLRAREIVEELLLSMRRSEGR
jgi:uncharacterized protein